jgi:hypothetical protein
LLKATGTSVLKSARRDFSRDFSADGRVSQWRNGHDNADCIADPKMKSGLGKTAP